MAAPVLSVIVPWMLPRKVCALELQAKRMAKTADKTEILQLLIGWRSSKFSLTQYSDATMYATDFR
jgi:hypothetical protein